MTLERDILEVLRSRKKSNASEIAKELDVAQKDVLKVVEKLKTVGVVTESLELTPEFREIDKHVSKS